MKQCAKCGQTLNDEAGFCTNCGTAVASADSQANNVQGGTQMVDMGGMSQQNFTSTQQPNPVMQQTNSSIAADVQQVDAGKGKSNGKIVAIVTACVVCLIVGIVGIVLAVVSMNGNDSKQVAVGGGSSNNGNDDNGNGNGASVVDVTSSGTKVEYAGYEFVIPSGYEYELSTGSDGSETLDVSKDLNQYLISIGYFDKATFAEMESNVDQLIEVLEQESPGVTARSETIDGVGFIYIDLGSQDGFNAAYLISEADLYCFVTTIITDQELDPQDYFEDVAEILSSAQKKSKMNRNTMDDGGNLDNINNLLKDAVKGIE